MRKYSISFVAVIIGCLLFVLGALVGSVDVRGIDFPFDDLLVNLSATFISIAAVAFTYEILGGEAIVKLVEYLIRLQHVAQNIDKMGITEFVDARRRFEYEQIHDDLKNTNGMFISSRTFDSIKYNDVRKLFANHLEKKGHMLRILLCKGSHNIDNLIEFKKTLPASHRSRFEIRQSEYLTCCIYGSDEKIYVTPYLNTLRGEEAPSMLCRNIGGDSIYAVYKAEFDDSWAKADPVQ